jgi:hypothetical protein
MISRCIRQLDTCTRARGFDSSDRIESGDELIPSSLSLSRAFLTIYFPRILTVYFSRILTIYLCPDRYIDLYLFEGRENGRIDASIFLRHDRSVSQLQEIKLARHRMVLEPAGCWLLAAALPHGWSSQSLDRWYQTTLIT